MPDKRKHRGKHPDDDCLFAAGQQDALRTAVAEYSWLRTRGYAVDSALKLVGDRHNLTVRQRTAVQRSSCSDQALTHRIARRRGLNDAAGQPLGIDGYNLLITVESALAGGLILVGRDGCCRDLAGVHGTYRKVTETTPAIELIVDFLTELAVPHIDWFLDRPVSNSGRLKALMAQTLEGRATHIHRSGTWNIELVDSPDQILCAYPHLVATSDSAVLDRCTAWVNLAAHIIDLRISTAWRVDLRAESAEL
jgi:hypothetical protein